MSSSRDNAAASDGFTFVEYIPKNATPEADKRDASKRNVRAQAARVSSNARLDTIRKRFEGRTGPHGQWIFPISMNEPVPCNALDQHRKTVARYRDREATVTVHAHNILGGSIPVAQANIATLARFLDSFKSGASQERPWAQLVMDEAGSSPTPSLISTAFMANASAVFANDLQQPDIRRHSTKQYLLTITKLRAMINSPKWRDPIVMYTCMILGFYELIQSSSVAARQAHVHGVAHLMEQTGPQGFVHGLQHKTFRYFRMNILMVSLADRKPTFLAETEWKNIPYSGDCPPKSVLELLVDILVEIPGVLAAVEMLRDGGLTKFSLIQKAFELAYWVRRLLADLERWKEDYMWTHPTICTLHGLRNLPLLAACKHITRMTPYEVYLGEALNCYSAAHLILTRIAQGLSARSFMVRSALRPPHTLRELVEAIIVISQRHISDDATAGLLSMLVTTFPLRIAQNTAELELGEPDLLLTLKELSDQVLALFTRKYNIKLSFSDSKPGL